LLIAYDLNLPWLVSQLKELYVEVAMEVLSENGKRPPQSRVSLVTGVHRKDVKKLVDDPPDPDPVSRRSPTPKASATSTTGRFSAISSVAASSRSTRTNASC